MGKEIEIYVCSSGERTFLNFYVSDDLRDQFFNELAKGSISSAMHPINLEFSVLPQWITDEEQRGVFESTGNVLHCRVPISNIEIHLLC